MEEPSIPKLMLFREDEDSDGAYYLEPANESDVGEWAEAHGHKLVHETRWESVHDSERKLQEAFKKIGDLVHEKMELEEQLNEQRQRCRIAEENEKLQLKEARMYYDETQRLRHEKPYQRDAQKLSGKKWLETRISEQGEALRRARENLRDEERRIQNRNLWLQQLRRAVRGAVAMTHTIYIRNNAGLPRYVNIIIEGPARLERVGYRLPDEDCTCWDLFVPQEIEDREMRAFDFETPAGKPTAIVFVLSGEGYISHVQLSEER